jgi:hypothetical protein
LTFLLVAKESMLRPPRRGQLRAGAFLRTVGVSTTEKYETNPISRSPKPVEQSHLGEQAKLRKQTQSFALQQNYETNPICRRAKLPNEPDC